MLSAAVLLSGTISHRKDGGFSHQLKRISRGVEKEPNSGTKGYPISDG